MAADKNQLVLITGVSGYIGIHCVRVCLDHGYRVRGTVRSLANEKKVAPVKELCPQAVQDGRLELVEADLLKEEGWDKVIEGCDFVLHVASPYPTFKKEPKPEDIIKPALDGTMNVLRACARCPSVKRVVLTSSIVAICVGNFDKTITEELWSDLSACDISTYEKSKTIAEKAAWDFLNQIKEGDNHFELVCLNPGMVTGPLLHDVECTSAEIVKSFLLHEMPLVPNLCAGIIDVRDVAQAHLEAIERPDAAGQRVILSHPQTYWFGQIAQDLADEFKSQGDKILPLRTYS